MHIKIKFLHFTGIGEFAPRDSCMNVLLYYSCYFTSYRLEEEGQGRVSNSKAFAVHFNPICLLAFPF